MVIYDKPKWHIDSGMNKKEVVDKFKLVFIFLSNNNMLSDEGLEQIEIGIDEECSLNEKSVNNKGKSFLEYCYEDAINFESKNILSFLNDKLISFNSKPEHHIDNK